MLGNFTLTLAILGGISLVILIITGISISKNSTKLTSFEKKVLFFVAFLLCFGVIVLYILSNLELFIALID
ncbi:hypothetical protein [Helicobacter winghamensis]|uniref:Uncharacterized protein n=1 Tax=Helicobacter winghamensis TaxID=157268 RepID=A0A2N3PKW1_9HELI|nr:hypothetical protein [Helicobacter winghamensis]EEO26682.1 hypothetical protein HWAG_01474 [Helicobacter winghamensis ATCC BAA-430]PKT79013.1 hypothetical protein BCM32_06530 [Helicobacter winghamensis]PKT79041.1 hypothetical protein BCM34_04255 [Helicobacter winghamensis]PKT79168.1 hypothetical protein BCM35_03795 [Helicobacter winghamensis]PKT81706.1 hypothetical protein BCM33_06145 [Helicobacter winghamensis]